jgi:NAD(P)-dependent dehydrogenase (short-subunit alcohol dehydrogenase family)
LEVVAGSVSEHASPTVRSVRATRIPVGALGTPEEVADVVAFVLSERATWINDANVAVDGAQGRPSAF